VADIIKRVNFSKPSMQRTVNFSNADANQGDVLLVEDSLGFAASNATIRCTVAAMRIRFNIYITDYPRRITLPPGDFMYTDHLDNLASGVRYTDETVGFVDINAGEIYELEGDFPIENIELVTLSGNFDCFLS